MRSPRLCKDLPASVLRQLNMYALAARASAHRQLGMYAVLAGAAEISLLALPCPADAKIVYTKTHRIIDSTYRMTFPRLGQVHPDDFTLWNGVLDNGRTYSFLEILPGRRGNGAVGNGPYAAALYRGSRIGGSRRFLSGTARLVWGYWSRGPWYGPWVNVKNRYLGLKFQINGHVHYGWARMNVSVTDGKGVSALLTGYAYETIPGKPIIAGATKDAADVEPTALKTPPHEPATLGMLALGAPALSIWRRENSVLPTPGANKSY